MPPPTRIALQTATAVRHARLTQLLDLVASCCVVVLLYCWCADLSEAGEGRYLSRSFLAAGFCNSLTQDTQLLCMTLDALAGLAFLVAGLVGGVHEALPQAAYLLCHAFGHYQLVRGYYVDEDPDAVDPVGLAILAGILSIGPLRGVGTIEAAGVRMSAATRYAIVTAAVGALVLVFARFLNRASYALLYINISILLCMSVPRLLLVGASSPRHVKARVGQHGDSTLFWAYFLTHAAVVLMVVLEPFTCDIFLARFGGHLLFDISLIALAVAGLFHKTAGSRASLATKKVK